MQPGAKFLTLHPSSFADPLVPPADDLKIDAVVRDLTPTPGIESGLDVDGARDSATLTALVAAISSRPGPLGPQTECMAKVIYHEAANQPLEGQLAIAQLILNRASSGRFPTSVCSVVNQPGQFFATRRFTAPAKSARWKTAIAVARVAMAYDLPQAAPGALFYHASYVRPSWSHKRVKVAQIGAHVFYR